MQEDVNLGHHETHTDRFAFMRRQHLAKVVPIRTKVVADFELLSHTHSHEKVAKLNLKDGVDTSSVKDCQHCGNKFGFFEKKHVCVICKRIVCVNDSYMQQLMPPATASVPICRKCHTFIKFHFHQAELKRRISEEQNNISVVYYTTLMAIKDEVVQEMPKFRGVVFSLSTIFGDTPEQQDKIREGRDDGVPLQLPGRTLEELFTQGMNSQKRLKHVFAALEERLQGIQAAASDTKTQQKMISHLKQAVADFLTTNLPIFRFNSQRLAEIKDHPKTRRWLVEAKEQIKQEEINAKRREQEEADRIRYQALVGDAPLPMASQHPALGTSPTSTNGSGHTARSFMSKVVDKAHQVSHSGSSLLSSAYHSMHRHMENLNESHLIPEISGVIPAICPTMGGVPLSIRGLNFHQNVRVYVGDKMLDEWQVLWKSPTELTIISPRLESEGPIDLAVENPNQAHKGYLEGVLFITNEPAILETFFGSAVPLPATGGKGKSVSSSNPSVPSSSATPSQHHPPVVEASKRYSLVTTPELPPGYAAAIAPSPSHLARPGSEPLQGSPPAYASLSTAPKLTSMGYQGTSPQGLDSPLGSVTIEPNFSSSTNSGSSNSTMKVSRTFGTRN